MQETGLEKHTNFGVAKFEYDFAREGGAVSTITLDDDILPDDALITRGMIEVKTAVTSAGAATIALHVNTSEDVLAATGKASFTAGAILDVVPVRTAATSIKTAAKKNLSCVIGTAAVTAGRFVVYLEYYLGV